VLVTQTAIIKSLTEQENSMNNKIVSIIVACGLILVLAGCARNKSVRHLAADASLITPHKSSRQEVLTYLGEPEEKHSLSDGSEVWTYYQVNKTVLRKTPYIGDKLGSEEHDVLRVIFQQDTVQDCTYRNVAEEDFKKGQGDGTP
jgi:hypothetical protein